MTSIKNWPYEFPGAYWLDENERRVLTDVLDNGSMFRYYGLGRAHYVDDLEAAARKFYGVEYALAVNSGTGALLCAMAALGIGPGCEVIVPSFMWVASISAIVNSGAIPVLCEVDESFTMDIADLERKITPRTALILPIHMAGAPCDMDGIMAIAKRHDIPVLEDCAQCNGGTYKDRKVGSIGDMGIYSLQLNKNMTCGEGGLLVTNDEQLFNRAFSAHDMGMVRRDGRLATPEDNALMWGQGRRMAELNGAVAYVQLGKLPDILAHMRNSKRRIKAALQGVPGLSFRVIHDAEGDTAPFIITILDSEAAALEMVRLLKEGGLHNVFRIADYGLHIYYNIPALVKKVGLSPANDPWALEANKASNYSYDKGVCPQSDALFSRSVLIPVPSCLTEELENQAAQLIREAVEKASAEAIDKKRG
jgi:dTDP-4-amino-4,6-dideoxygalactose transaminase